MSVFLRFYSEGWASISPRGTVPLRTARRVHVSTCTFTRCGLSFRAMPQSPFEYSYELSYVKPGRANAFCVVIAQLASRVAAQQMAVPLVAKAAVRQAARPSWIYSWLCRRLHSYLHGWLHD